MSNFNVGFRSLLKEGSKHLSGLEEAILRNIEACKALSQITRTSLGPNGLNKMVINHLEKLFVTSDAATIIKELEVVHPAAKMLVMASQMQEQECGDGTNTVIVFGGELLQQAELLIRNGLHPSDIIAGYTTAQKKSLEILENLATYKCDDPSNVDKVAGYLKSVISAKQYGWENTLAPLIAKACIQILPKNPQHFNVENVRVAKILGGGVTDTKLIKGFAIVRDAEGTIKHVKNAKIAVLVAGLEPSKPETKGTVVLQDAQALLNFAKNEEKIIEETIKQVADSGAQVIVSGGNVSEIALHFIERYKLMVIKITSKFDLRRLCKATGATPLVRVGTPSAEELGYCDSVSVDEIGDQKVCIFSNDAENARLSTIIIRSSTQNFLDDLERCVDDAVNVYKGLVKDPRLVPGAGAVELEIARQLQHFADSSAGLDQHAIRKYAEAFEVFPRTLAENAGLNSIDIISSLYASHQNGNTADGIDVEEGQVKSAIDLGVLDLFTTKHSAIKLASDVVITILRVDQIIMARPAGGPKVPRQGARDSD